MEGPYPRETKGTEKGERSIGKDLEPFSTDNLEEYDNTFWTSSFFFSFFF